MSSATLTSDVDTTSSLPSLRERAIALAPRIAERAAEVDEQRFVHEETIQELHDAGLLKAYLPKAYGGDEASPEDFVAACIEIGKACSSTAWVLCILSVHNWEMAHMPKLLQDELWADDPTTLISSSYASQGTARPVDGGYIMNGRWRSSSGIVHSKWAIIGADVEVDGRTVAHNFVIPLAEAEVIDDWYVLGMCGTGSRSVVADELFVPHHRVIDREVMVAMAGPGLRENTGPLYRVPQGLLFSPVAGAPALGSGWAFYDGFREVAKKYVRRLDNNVLAEDRNTHVLLAESRAVLMDQERNLLRVLNEANRKAVANEEYTSMELASGMYEISRGATAALSVAQNLMPLLGPAAVYSTNPLTRLYRDLLTARQHATQNPELYAPPVGRLELGAEGTNVFLLPEDVATAARVRAERQYS